MLQRELETLRSGRMSGTLHSQSKGNKHSCVGRLGASDVLLCPFIYEFAGVESTEVLIGTQAGDMGNSTPKSNPRHYLQQKTMDCCIKATPNAFSVYRI